VVDQPTPPQSPLAPSPIAPRTELLAIVSLVLAILSWVICLLFGSIPAIICGHLSRSKIRKSNGALRGMEIALAGLIIGYLEIHSAYWGVLC
jgi:threonine/homoserine/homoserine lactone efflux protein